jgi:hypothetical protein
MPIVGITASWVCATIHLGSQLDQRLLCAIPAADHGSRGAPAGSVRSARQLDVDSPYALSYRLHTP